VNTRAALLSLSPPARSRAIAKLPRSKIIWRTLVIFSASLSWTQGPRPTVPQVEAAYLYNFGKFVTWPPDRTTDADQFRICILGKDPFGSVLDSTVAGERIGGRQIAIQRITHVQQAAPCNILFVSASEEDNLRPVLDEANRLHILTVSDLKRFTQRGGVIGLSVQEERVRFEVNRKAAERSHLQLSSELLKVAFKVIDKDEAGK
jgi:hypothetical protein